MNKVERIIDAINVRYIYSACVITTTPNVTILHDPWFTEGIYDGSWYHFPKIENPIDSIGNVDLIYISHVHPDHYDSAFLKKYFLKFGIKKVIIADHHPNHLANKMKSDGIEPLILKERLVIGETIIEIVPHKTGSISDIDSAIIVKYKSKDHKNHCIVNANDIIFDDEMRSKLKFIAENVDILLCGYTGAGPYPQTYFDTLDEQLIIEANNKKQAFFERYKTLINKIDAKINIPFAGKYVLGGKLVGLNEFRGVADPVEVLEFDKRAIVLADNGGEIDTNGMRPSAVRTSKYNDMEKEKRFDEIRNLKFDYERLISEEEIDQLPIKRLLSAAARNAINRSECEEDYFFCFRLPNNDYAVINANKNKSQAINIINSALNLPIPRSEITIDIRYLFGLLTNVYHWNNAEVGSQYETRRIPNILNRKAQSFLNYLAI
jgi:UDP-MurNAc hydroxylase